MDSIEPAGFRSSHDAALPLHRPAWISGKELKRASPTCCCGAPGDMPSAEEYVAPAGFRSSHDAALPLQRLAWGFRVSKYASPTCRVADSPFNLESIMPAGCRLVTVHCACAIPGT